MEPIKNLIFFFHFKGRVKIMDQITTNQKKAIEKSEQLTANTNNFIINVSELLNQTKK